MIYENENYEVKGGNVYDKERDVYIDGYTIINKETNVVEKESRILPEAIQVADFFNTNLIELRTRTEGNVVNLNG